MKHPCEDLEIWIERLRDGDLAGDALRDARRHLELCGTCHARFAELEELGSILKEGLADVAPPIAGDELTRRIMASLPASRPESAARRDRQAVVPPLPELRPWQLAMAAAVAGFVLVASFLWMSRNLGTSEPVETAQTVQTPQPTQPAQDAAEAAGEGPPVEIELASNQVGQQADPADGPIVRVVDSADPDWKVVWIGSEPPP